MEIKGKGIGDGSAYIPPSSNKLIIEQAVNGGMAKRRDIVGCSLDLSIEETLMREKEKKRIRQEILLEEFLRRRELEEEVRTELILEGKIMMRRETSLLASPHLSMGEEIIWGPLLNSKEGNHTEVGASHGLPFQRQPKATSGAAVKPLFNLCKDKPAPSVKPVLNAAAAATVTAATKRKLETSITADCQETCSASKANKKQQVDWSCDLCQVKTTSEDQLKAHLNGKKHKAKEKASIRAATNATKAKEKALIQAATNATKAKEKALIQVATNATKATDDQLVEVPTGPANKFWCTLCNVGASDKAQMNAHKVGNAHLRLFMEKGGCLTTIETVPDNNFAMMM